MRAVEVPRFGGPDVLELRNLPDPIPGPGQVLVAASACDVLFVDTTHTVKLASDVDYILLDVLPHLEAGVLVHFHDIFLPWEYPRVWFEEMRYFWTEQYLLQAFLAFNEAFEVPAHAIARLHPERLTRVVSSFRAGVTPGSFWLRRRGADGSSGQPQGSNGERG